MQQHTTPSRETRPATGEFKRSMKARHLVMLSLGGVIGTGLFFNTGYIISTTGAAGTLLAYLIGALVVLLVMLSLGELSVAMPETGAFHLYATRYLNPATGYTVAWLYWLTWTVALGSSLTAAGFCMQYWFPGVPIWIWCLVFCVLIFVLNVISSRFFAEGEFWFSLIKVITILAFIVLGAGAMFGVIPLNDGAPPPLFHNITAHGWFPMGGLPILMTMVAVNFAFSGTELIGIAAGETENPHKVVPLAIRTTVVRLILFFMGTVVVLAALIPMEQAGIEKSPFVMVFEKIGIPYAADIFNFVILTAILSAANSGLYASGRMLWSLSNERTLPACFSRLTSRGIPLFAISVSMLGGLLALASSIVAPDTVYVALSAISGFAVVAVWLSICASHYAFRRHHVRAGLPLSDLKYRAPWFPFTPIVGFILCLLACIGLVFDPTQRIALWCGLPFVALCYAAYYFTQWRQARRFSKEVIMLPKNSVAALLQTSPVIILDGALATELEARGCDLNDPLWSATVLLENPALIYQVHRDYFEAGAHCAITASYQATPLGFKARGLDEAQSAALIRKSVELAVQARDDYRADHPQARPLLVAGAVGPYGAYLANGAEYRGDYQLPQDDMMAFHRPRIAALVAAGVDVLACETQPSLPEMVALVALLREFPQVSAWFSFTLRDAQHLSDGSPLRDVVALLDNNPQVVAVGINCIALEQVTAALTHLSSLTTLPLVVYPNSGEHYDATTKRWSGEEASCSLAGHLPAWRAAGARLIGGCCRTTPHDIAAIAHACQHEAH